MENRPASGGGGGGAGGGRGNNNRNRKSRGKRTRRKGGESRRRRGKKDKNKNNKNAQRNKGPPAPPQTKIILRNIGDATKYGSIKNVVGLIRTIFESANQKLFAASSRIIQFEESSLEVLIREEEIVLKALEEAKKKKEEEKKAAEEGESAGEEDNKNDNLVENNGNGETEESKNGTDGTDTNTKRSSGIQDEKQDAPSVAPSTADDASTVNLSARVVYIVPPKQTHRRGIKPGCAYIVISGPRIEVKDALPPITISATASELAKDEKKDTDVECIEEATSTTTKGEEGVGTNGTEVNEGPSAATSNVPNDADTTKKSNQNHVTIVDPSSTTNAASREPSAVPDYSRDIAMGRFLIMQAVEMLEAQTKEDAKADQHYAGSMVEVALSGKTYKHQNNRRDRREGTVEQTADFKNFVEKAARDKEERMARPKPSPGGGTAAPSANATTPTPGAEIVENGQPISALVAHIRSKHAEASKRKKAKKKSKDSSMEKGKGGGAGGKSSRKKKNKKAKEEGGEKGRRKKDGKKKKRSRKRVGEARIDSGPPPTLLKPGPGHG